MDVTIDDMQRRTAMIAIQGPESTALLADTVTGALVEELPRHGCMEFELMGSNAFISQGGYTGEDGYEIVIDAGRAHALWRGLLSARTKPCGLGARDTLRLEAALLLYGNDIDSTTNPFEAGLGWVVDLDDEPFVGREALLGDQGGGREAAPRLSGSGRKGDNAFGLSRVARRRGRW